MARLERSFRRIIRGERVMSLFRFSIEKVTVYTKREEKDGENYSK